jgi:hypothetical protein
MNPLGETPFQNNELLFSVEHLTKLEKKYMKPLASKLYDEINNDLLDYTDLYSYISNIEVKTQRRNMKLLLKITLSGLTGAIHAFHLNKKNVELNLENMILKNKLETVLSDKNSIPVNEIDGGRLSLVKTFNLAPLYSYYIILFGIPENGFESDKLNQIICFMQKYNIDPYQ